MPRRYKLKRSMLITTLVAGTIALMSTASWAKDVRIGYSVFWGTNPFLVTMVNGAEAAA